MDTRLPHWVASHAAARDDAEAREYAALTPAQRWERFVAVSRLAATLLSVNPARETAIALRDPRSAESEALWRRLMLAHRGR